jgi:hypothetical protein
LNTLPTPFSTAKQYMSKPIFVAGPTLEKDSSVFDSFALFFCCRRFVKNR